jgi:P27 family predicted phage terminase small subunit
LAGYPGKQGRKPTPTSLKALQGNPGKRPLNDQEPRPRTVLPRCPAHLSPEAKAEWKRVSKMLHRLGLLTEMDTTALALYCQTYSRWVEAEKKLASFGLLIKTSGDLPQQSPYLSIANKTFNQMRAMLVEFGMTPSSRSRLAVLPPQEEENDPFQKWLGQREQRRKAS